MSVHIRSPALTWESRVGACEVNKEKIMPLAMGGFSKRKMTLAKCRKECEVRPGCSAVDYYKATKKCLHYAESCVNPLGSKDIATSHWISRTPLTLQEVADRKKKSSSNILLKNRAEEEASVEVKADSGFSVASESKSELDEEAEEDVRAKLSIGW